MDLGLSGKRAIVLSSSRGLGRGIAEALAAEGAHVLMTARSGDRLKEAADAIGKKGPGRASTFVGDLKDNVEAIHQAVKDIHDLAEFVIRARPGQPFAEVFVRRDTFRRFDDGFDGLHGLIRQPHAQQ